MEVLLLSDRIDEWLVTHLTEFDGKPLQSVTKGDLDLGAVADEEKKQQEQVAAEDQDLVARLKTALAEQAQDVRVTHRLTDSPACLEAGEDDRGGAGRVVARSKGLGAGSLR